MKAFQDKQSVLWLGSVALLVIGLLAAFLLLPATRNGRSSQPTPIHVPKMENVPSDEEHKLKLDINKEP